MSFDRYKQLREEINERMKEVRKIGQSAFNEAAQTVFEKNPNLKWFSWAQYTPYFNDGDECVFRTQTEYPEFCMTTGTGEDDDEDENIIEEFYVPYQCKKDKDGREKRPVDSDHSEEEWNAGLDILSFLEGFMDEDYKEFFGDHCKVTVYKDHIDVDEYSHD